MEDNYNDSLLKRNETLGLVLKQHLAILRFAFGNMILEGRETDSMVTLVRANADGRYKLLIMDPYEISRSFDDDRCRHKQFSEYLARQLVFGLAEYVMISSEVGILRGTKEDVEDFNSSAMNGGYHKAIEMRPEVDRTASLVMYDLSGIIVRGYAPADCCIQTFLQFSTIERLNKDIRSEDSKALDNERSALEYIASPLDWVMDDRESSMNYKADNGLNVIEGGVLAGDLGVGPLHYWDESVVKVLEDLHGKMEH